MRSYVKGRGLEPFDRVACAAFSLVGARGKLPVVRILVAIRAKSMGHRSLEVTMRVAIGARHGRVLSKQREIRLRMIETLQLRHAIPACCVVAGLARPREGAFVRIGVAAGTRRERQPNVLHKWLCVSHCHVALRAGHGRVSAGQRKFRSGMVEPRGGLPGACGVARRAVSAELPAVLVYVATLAIGRKPKVGVVQVLDQNPRARSCRNVCRFVAIVAPDGGVATGKGKAGLAVVHRFAVRLPANQRKVGAVMLGMAGHAILACRVRRKPGSVHTASLRHPLANLGMAIEASKLHLSAAKCVALRAVQRARKRFMRFR